MYYSKTAINSEHASRYLQTLCRHFSRKVPAQWNEETGKVNFPMGDCLFESTSEKHELRVTCSASSPEELALIKGTLESHITMFSRREKINVGWMDSENLK